MRNCFSLEVKGGGKCTQCENSSPRKFKAEMTWYWIQPPDFAIAPWASFPSSLFWAEEMLTA